MRNLDEHQTSFSWVQVKGPKIQESVHVSMRDDRIVSISDDWLMGPVWPLPEH